jgi:hypothetical protein
LLRANFAQEERHGRTVRVATLLALTTADVDPTVRAAATRRLASDFSSRSLPRLLDALGDDDWQVRAGRRRRRARWQIPLAGRAGPRTRLIYHRRQHPFSGGSQ